MVDAYIDFTATYDGDGTSAAPAASNGAVGAFNEFNLADYSAMSTWNIWIRRAGSYVLAANLALNQSNVSLIGWPVVGDVDYSGRPASGTSNGWDSDVQTYAVITVADATKNITVSTGAGQHFRRMQFTNTAVDAGNHTWFSDTVTAEFTNCWFGFAGNGTTVHPSASTHPYDVLSSFTNCIFECTANGTALLSEFNACSYVGCTFRNTSSTVAGTVVVLKDGDQQLYEDCTFTVTSGTVTQMLLQTLVSASSKKSTPVFLGCSFDDGTVTAWGKTIELGAAASFLSCTFAGHKINVKNAVANTIWDPAAFPVHFVAMTFKASSVAADAHVNCNPDASGLVLTYAGPAAAIDMVANNVTIPDGCHQSLAPWSSKFTFRNLVLGTDWNPQPAMFGDSHNYVKYLDWPGASSFDHQGVKGAWYEVSNYGRRYLGGGSASPAAGPFRFTLETQAHNDGGAWAGIRWIPQQLSDDKLVVKLAAGTRHITLYKQSACNEQDFWFEVEYLDAGSGAHRVTTSSYSGTMAADLTWRAVTMTISVGQDCYAAVRIFYSDRCGGGTYLDPFLVIT